MAVRQVLRMGHPTLLEVAQPVTEFNTPELDELIADMFETMADYGGVGLAAPQIGVSQRIVIFGFEDSERYPDAEPVPTTVLINPKLEFIGSEEALGWEGCLSVPNMRGVVSRYQHLRYSGLDQTGQPFERTVQGFHARVVQHECDHLDGTLYTHKLASPKLFGFNDELDAAQKAREEEGKE